MPIIPHLIADQFGSHIGKYSERLQVTQKGTTLQQAPLLHLEAVYVLNRGVSISADALEACCNRGIPVYFIDSIGTPYAAVYAGGLAGTVLTRREQLRAFDDWRGGYLARQFASGKILNQAITLKYLSKTRKDSPAGAALRLAADEVQDHLAWLERLTGETADDLRPELLAAEGNAASRYWQAVIPLMPPDYGWVSREGRGASDPVNQLLNYGYGILYGQIERALVLAGLDPYGGFIHVDRPGKPSLTLDLIEEFRQAAVDRVVFGLAARNFTVDRDDQGRMSEETRKTFASHILEHLESGARYEGQRRPLGQIIQTQARRLAGFLRGDRENYEPYKAEW
ncbi:MAG: CRISPR-associated protein Cas1 [Chloroflexi bacterium OLB15]|nr:MAG: CRISPR-associated protein Cas1 [Chloroflexi bacterium OLB15]